MTKVAILADSHFGTRNDSEYVLTNQEKFYSDLFFPTLKERGIKTIIHAGDLFDKRKNISIYTLTRFREIFESKIIENDIKVHLTLGNHDVYYKTTNSVNSPNMLVNSDHFIIYDKAVDVNVHGFSVLMIPWLTKDNMEESLKTINTSKSSIAIGHLEIAGFPMYRGILATHGMDTALFDHFDIVLSGHFHHKSSSKNIHYLGSPTHYTWMDHGDPRGFHILDLETRELEFIEYTNSLFNTLTYDDEKFSYDTIEWNDEIFNALKGKYVKLYVDNRTDPVSYSLFVENINKAGVADLAIVDNTVYKPDKMAESVVATGVDTLELFTEFTKNVKDDGKRKKLDVLLRDTYIEAQKMIARGEV